MRKFFTPGIALMRRLNYTMKFVLLWFVSLLAVAVVLSNLHASLDKEIRRSEKELEGMALATPISRTVQILQQHRGLSAAVLAGNREMVDGRSSKEKEASESLATLERRLPPNLAGSEDWREIRNEWTHVKDDGLRWPAEENFAAHTRLIYRLLLFKVTVSGEFVLPLDPQIDTVNRPRFFWTRIWG